MTRRIAFLLLILTFCLPSALRAQELNATVRINYSQVQGTNTSVFTTLENAIAQFLNNHEWTDLQFQREEKIDCTFNITVKKYDASSSHFSCELLFNLNRPTYNSAYVSTLFSNRDASFEFDYRENDPLEYNENNLDNNLTAMLAFYAYLFIGMDLDSFAPLGGSDVLRMAESVCNNAQSIGGTGWRAFDDNRNRHAIINDYMETSMESLRRFQYKYYREGLDEMSNNADRGRTAVTEAIQMLGEAYHNKPMSLLPQIFTEFKRDELVSIYTGHGTEKEKNGVYDVLSNINAAQNNYWNKIKK
ncbi:MAG: DUF4835 family protein [Bacteroidaceae bacterium]|nr:DUF4835 family protein [Bacteroidaceae bacterium]